MSDVVVDVFDARRAVGAGGLLGQFNQAGVLAAADVHVARRLCALCGEEDEAVALAVALAVRGPRLGHVFVDLATIRETATVDVEDPVDLSGLPWPHADGWVAGVTRSPLVRGDVAPLHVEGSALYLDRYWREERAVAADLLARAGDAVDDVDMGVLADGLARVFPGQTESRQCLAAATAVLRRLTVIAGGPGTGKTTTVARIVALLSDQAAAAGAAPPLVALGAPTGKAAARLQEAVHEQAADLPVTDSVRESLLALEGVTLHRLLGARPGTSRLRHHRGNRLPHDVVIVDETSMVSLSQMARLLAAVRPDARLVLVGDPNQLRSIEAGAVLGDIVGPSADALRLTGTARDRLAQVTGRLVAAEDVSAETPLADGILVLNRVHRYREGGGIASLAEAIRRGDAHRVMAILHDPPSDVAWIDADVEAATDAQLAAVRDGALAAGRAVFEAAAAGDARAAFNALGRFRILCAHRRGPHGVATWNPKVEAWLADAVAEFTAEGRFYVGRPLLVTENDYELRLYNGDTGVVVSTGDRVAAAFERSNEIVQFGPTRLDTVETVYAMTIHKSQGSQFATAAILLPPPESRLLTRELLYTAATRAQERLVLVGSEEAIGAAVDRPIARASGLLRALSGDPPG